MSPPIGIYADRTTISKFWPETQKTQVGAQHGKTPDSKKLTPNQRKSHSKAHDHFTRPKPHMHLGAVTRDLKRDKRAKSEGYS